MLYFDHNATTFVAPEVCDALNDGVRRVFGNASSTHRQGQIARQCLEKARRTLAEFLKVSPTEFVFTSGGTEANNLSIAGLVRGIESGRKHVVTTAIEHPSVLETCAQLQREGIEVTYVPVGSSGAVALEDLRSSIGPDTVLVSVMHANNETGVMQPVAEIAALVRELRESGRQIFLHSDGVQALGKVPVDLREPGVDLYSMSAHKLFAPKGVGGLFVRRGVPLRGIQHGGRQERQRRAGTENVPGAMAFARAAELCGEYDVRDLADLRDRFEQRVLDAVPEAEVNGAAELRLPNTSNLLFRGVSAEAMVIALDMKGMAVSTGSACSSGSVEPSHVLLAMGRSREEARSSVRFSFGRYNTREEIDTLADAVIQAAGQLRKPGKREKRLAAV